MILMKQINLLLIKKMLMSMIHNRYSNLPFFERIEEIAERYSMQNYKGSSKKHPTYRRLIFQNSNIERDLKEIYINFFSVVISLNIV